MTSRNEPSRLHVTSGDVLADALRQAFPGETVIAWRDVLHEGPIPGGITDDQLASIRASFLSSCGWGDSEALRQELQERNRLLCTAFRLLLWFEYDMHDQVQLLQVLSMVESQEVDLIEFPPGAIKELSDAWVLLGSRRTLTRAHLAAARKAWEDLRAPQPTAWWQHVPDMPYLHDALRRLFEQLPGSDGLSRTERQILEEVEQGAKTSPELIRAMESREEYPFLGDSVLQVHLKRLTSGFNPPLAPEPYSLTESGKRILRGESNLMEENGIDRWVGGVHFWTH